MDMTRFYRWINGWIKIVEGLLTILTFTLIRPSWSLNFTIWALKRNCPDDEEYANGNEKQEDQEQEAR